MLLGRFATPRLTKLLNATLKAVSSVVLASRTRSIARIDVTSQLGLCRVPLLYLRGTHDRLVARGSWESIQRVSPQATLVELTGPHLLLQTRPKEAVTAIIQFAETPSHRAGK